MEPSANVIGGPCDGAYWDTLPDTRDGRSRLAKQTKNQTKESYFWNAEGRRWVFDVLWYVLLEKRCQGKKQKP